MSRYKILLFDADRTLFDFDKAEHLALCEALWASHVKPTAEIVSAYTEINDSLWCALEKGQIEREALKTRRFELLAERFSLFCNVEALAKDYIDALSEKTCLIDGAEELLSALFGRVKMYIVTNGNARVQRRRYELSTISRFFEDIFISEEIGADKPSVAFFECVARRISDFSAEDALIIGDSLSSDIKGGINFGIDTCWFSPADKDCGDDVPTYTVRELSQIFDIALGGD